MPFSSIGFMYPPRLAPSDQAARHVTEAELRIIRAYQLASQS
jgi:hypothetical protein